MSRVVEFYSKPSKIRAYNLYERRQVRQKERHLPGFYKGMRLFTTLLMASSFSNGIQKRTNYKRETIVFN